MATRQGRRYGAEKGIQRNKEEEPGQRRPNRSPGQSNANRVIPSPSENVGSSQMRDVQRIGTGMNPTGQSALTRSAQQQAAGRAILRTASRAGMGANILGAAAAGYESAKEESRSRLSAVDARESYKNIVGTGGSKDNLPGFKVSESKSTAAPKRAKAKEVSAYDIDPNAGAVREGPHSGISGETRESAMEDVNKHKWKGSYDYDD